MLGASPGASELVKAPAVPVPSYFTIETSHAKKVYCAPTEAACAAWVDRIRRGGQARARQASTAPLPGDAERKTSLASSSGRTTPRSRQESKSWNPFSRMSKAASSGDGEGRKVSVTSPSAAPKSVQLDDVALSLGDDEVDRRFPGLLQQLGIPKAKQDAMLKMPLDKKREMLAMYAQHQAQDAAQNEKLNPAASVEMLRDDAPYDGLKTLSVHLKSCGMEWVRAFLQAGAVDAFAACVGALCRFEERSEDDAYKIEAALACLKALMKTEEGIAAMVASEQLCTSFVAGGGSLLLADTDALLGGAVQLLTTVIVWEAADGSNPCSATPT